MRKGKRKHTVFFHGAVWLNINARFPERDSSYHCRWWWWSGILSQLKKKTIKIIIIFLCRLINPKRRNLISHSPVRSPSSHMLLLPLGNLTSLNGNKYFLNICIIGLVNALIHALRHCQHIFQTGAGVINWFPLRTPLLFILGSKSCVTNVITL